MGITHSAVYDPQVLNFFTEINARTGVNRQNEVLEAATQFQGKNLVDVIDRLCSQDVKWGYRYSIDQVNQEGNTALHILVQKIRPSFGAIHHPYTTQDLECIKHFILTKKPTITKKNIYGHTILDEMVWHGDDLITDKYEEPHNINAVAFILDLIKHHTPFLSFFRKSTTIDGNTALHLAAAFGQPKTVKLLLERGWDVNCRNKTDMTPLHYTLVGNTQGHIEAAEILLKSNKIDVNIKAFGLGTAFEMANGLLLIGLNSWDTEKSVFIENISSTKVPSTIKDILEKRGDVENNKVSPQSLAIFSNVYYTGPYHSTLESKWCISNYTRRQILYNIMEEEGYNPVTRYNA
jgi:plasmid maintenance system antidote protein VapI